MKHYYDQFFSDLTDPASLGRFFSVLLALSLVGLLPWTTQAQDIGGPYEADSSTVLLMHFNGDLVNESDSSGDGTTHGSISFIEESGLRSELGQALRIENGSPQDSSYVTVADTGALDLTGSWTIELWVNVFTFGEDSDDWRRQPRIVNKPGDPWYQANYWIYLRGAPRNFWTGYREDIGDGSYPEIISPENSLQAGQWYHFAFIRDTSKNVLVQLLHRKNQDGELEQVFFGTYGFDPVTESPPTTNDNPLFIGNAFTEGSDYFLDGFVDELRISTTVRNYSLPPIIRNVETLGNQPANTDYPIEADITTLGDNSVESATLHYRVNEGDFQSLTMAEGEQEIFSADIPGQQLGDRIQYYVEANDPNGNSAYSPSNAPQDSSYYEFAVWEAETQTLHLSFEEGSGTPADSSQYGNPVEVVNGDPVYSDDAALGQYSFHVQDSTYLSLDSPFLSSNRLRAELWFNADSVVGGRRLFTSSSPTWYNTNAQIWFANNQQVKAGGYFPESADGYIEATIDSTIESGTWYHAAYQVMADSIMFELRDSNDELIQRKFTGHGSTNPVQATQPLALGQSPVEGHQYHGKIDEVKLYNYPTDTTFTSIREPGGADLPEEIALGQNYPNPFNPATNISYELPRATHVTLTVYDMLGRKVRTLIDSQQQAGSHSVTFEAGELSSGVYLYRLQADGISRTNKMMLMK